MGRVRVYMKLNVMYMYLENTLNNLSNIKNFSQLCLKIKWNIQRMIPFSLYFHTFHQLYNLIIDIFTLFLILHNYANVICDIMKSTGL